MHNREEQGHLIAQINGSVKRINEKEYVVNSKSNGGIYHVHMSGLGSNFDNKQGDVRH